MKKRSVGGEQRDQESEGSRREGKLSRRMWDRKNGDEERWIIRRGKKEG